MAKWAGLILVVLCLSCGDKKSSLSGEDKIEAEDFIAAFPQMKLPTTLYDTSLGRIGDTTTISYTVFSQFVSDSALKQFFPQNKNLKIKPVGSIQADEETYLLTKFIQNKSLSLNVFVFDKENKFLAAKELVTNKSQNGYRNFVSINREPTFSINRERITKDNKLLYTRAGYAFNKDAGFMVVVNDSNEDPNRQDSIINPIDTFGRKNTFSGDYLKDKKNFISIRDGKNASTYLFFIHFENKNSDCTGELKGEMQMKADKVAQYAAGGDPCVVNFKFAGSQVQVKEEGSCGNHRGIKCFFNDTYTKKKVAKPKQKKRR
jgi:hypothetical protein